MSRKLRELRRRISADVGDHSQRFKKHMYTDHFEPSCKRLFFVIEKVALVKAADPPKVLCAYRDTGSLHVRDLTSRSIYLVACRNIAPHQSIWQEDFRKIRPHTRPISCPSRVITCGIQDPRSDQSALVQNRVRQNPHTIAAKRRVRVKENEHLTGRIRRSEITSSTETSISPSPDQSGIWANLTCYGYTGITGSLVDEHHLRRRWDRIQAVIQCQFRIEYYNDDRCGWRALLALRHASHGPLSTVAIMN